MGTNHLTHWVSDSLSVHGHNGVCYPSEMVEKNDSNMLLEKEQSILNTKLSGILFIPLLISKWDDYLLIHGYTFIPYPSSTLWLEKESLYCFSPLHAHTVLKTTTSVLSH